MNASLPSDARRRWAIHVDVFDRAFAVAAGKSREDAARDGAVAVPPLRGSAPPSGPATCPDAD